MIILDCNDLSKTLLTSSDRLKDASTILSSTAQDAQIDATFDLTRIFVLADHEPHPLVQSVVLNARHSVLEELRSTVYVPEDVKIKKEEGDESTQAEQRAVDWTAAYKTLIDAINVAALRTSNRSVFDSCASKARTHITAVISLAEHYQALAALRDAFRTSVLKWINNRSLHKAIAEEPVDWLKIGATMQNTNTFDEAFMHCVGYLDSYPKSMDDLPPELRLPLVKKAAALQARRLKANEKLKKLVLLIAVRVRPGYRAKAAVNTKNAPLEWLVNQLFKDWIVEHIDYLFDDYNSAGGNGAGGVAEDEEGDEAGAAPEVANIETTATCDHKNKCLTVGGFYRLVGKGGNAYLPLGEAIGLLEAIPGGEKIVKDPKKIRDALARLKDDAATIVKDLVWSCLSYEGREGLEYLTCVEVGREDYPWDVEDE